jgi:hypothetical protein
MKKLYTGSLLIAGILALGCFTSSCTKATTEEAKPKEVLIVRDWWINRIQLKIYYNNTFFKDTILPNLSKPRNFSKIDADGSFQYCYNSATIETGTYQFKGTDSLIATTNLNTYRWKLLTIIDGLFTTVSTSTNDPAFPGAKVETYHTFTK